MSAHTSRALVAVVGMGLVTPGASGPEDFWELLRTDRPVFGEPVRRYDPHAFHSADPDAADRTYGRTFGEITGFVPHRRLEPEWTADSADLQVGWLRHSLLQALDTAALPPDGRCGLYVAASSEASHELDAALAADLAAAGMAVHSAAGPEGHHGAGVRDEVEDVRARIRAAIAETERCADRHHCRFLPHEQVRRAACGVLPDDTRTLVVDNICPAGLYAVDLGVTRLIDGEVDIAFCGGMSAHGPLRQVYFAKMGALSRSGDVRAFDAAADGTMFSDGAAAVALKRLDDAHRDGDAVLGVLVGFGGASDGGGKAIFAPNPTGQVRAMRRAHEVNAVPASEVAWVVAHGTATVTGDHVELCSIATAYAEKPTWATSNKTIAGHTGMACGIVSLIQAITGLNKGVVPAQRRFTARAGGAADQEQARVPTEDVPLTPPAASDGSAARDGSAAGPTPRPLVGVFACGLGGINGHLLVQHPDRPVGGLVSARPCTDQEVAVVGWSAVLPGYPDRAAVRQLLADPGAPLPAASFGEHFDPPPFSRVRVAPGIARQIDRCQHLALLAVADFVDHHGRCWDGLEERTGVFGVHYGSTHLGADSTVRGFADALRRRFAGTPDEKACEAFLSEHGARTAPIGPYTLPGRMPCVALGWIANRHDLHGPTMILDCGLDSGLAAIHVASGQLRRGELDVALVLGLNTGPPRETARFLGVDPHEIAEGAFLLALTRRKVAAARGWNVPALVSTCTTPPSTAIATGECGLGAGAVTGRPTYLAADGVVAVMRAIEQRPRLPRRLDGPSGFAVTVLPPTDPSPAQRWR
ncbi:beta-ketoacyl synthase N-terminal-like domain-containing protein [Actinomadura gamaensis]|uniref:Beta-ketoacyl synthase N-terminal-like domain-containing protein n=1 Tax=Actinomadura gamaensis TaxID=1763541 RepID=A0ABV9UD62_9ACTN